MYIGLLYLYLSFNLCLLEKRRRLDGKVNLEKATMFVVCDDDSDPEMPPLSVFVVPNVVIEETKQKNMDVYKGIQFFNELKRNGEFINSLSADFHDQKSLFDAVCVWLRRNRQYEIKASISLNTKIVNIYKIKQIVTC